MKCGVFLTSQYGRLFTFLCVVRIFNKKLLRADPCCCSIIKEFAHALSCAYIELWMLLGSLESTQKARVALGCAASYSYALYVLSKLSARIHNSIRTLSMNKFLILFSLFYFQIRLLSKTVEQTPINLERRGLGRKRTVKILKGVSF